jgi:hypothetical protein
LFPHPDFASQSHLGAPLLGRVKAFFLKLILRKSKNRQSAALLVETPRSRIRLRLSSSVMSGCPAIKASSHSARSSSGERRWPRTKLGSKPPAARQRRTHLIAEDGLTK